MEMVGGGPKRRCKKLKIYQQQNVTAGGQTAGQREDNKERRKSSRERERKRAAAVQPAVQALHTDDCATALHAQLVGDVRRRRAYGKANLRLTQVTCGKLQACRCSDGCLAPGKVLCRPATNSRPFLRYTWLQQHNAMCLHCLAATCSLQVLHCKERRGIQRQSRSERAISRTANASRRFDRLEATAPNKN